MIYYGQEYTEDEKKAIQAVIDLCKEQGIPVPATDQEILRILVKKGMHDPKKALDGVFEKFKIEEEYLPVVIKDVHYQLIKDGFVYFAGRDRHYRPYCVLRLSVMMNSSASDEDIMQTIVSFYNWIFHHTQMDGHVENIISIIDAKDITLMGMRWNLLKRLMPTVSVINGGKSRGVFVLNTFSVVSMIFKMVSMFIDANTLAKFNATSDSTNDLLKAMVAPQQLEEKYGGTAPDRDDYWPPTLMDFDFGNEDAKVVQAQE